MLSERLSLAKHLTAPAEEAEEMARDNVQRARDAQVLSVRRLIKLGAGYYWDPVKRQLLRKTSDRYLFVRHDRRGPRRTQEEAEIRQFRMITGGLFWDAAAKKLYRKAGDHYVLYSRDRRKIAGRAPGSERRRGR